MGVKSVMTVVSFVAKLLGWLLILLFAIAGGMIWGWTEIDDQRPQMMKVGAWQSDPAIGSVGASAKLRASVARWGLLALSREEAIYFTAHEDQWGEALREECSYLVEGTDPQARWWSLTLYAEDMFLAQNKDERHSVSADNVKRNFPRADGRGSWQVEIRGNAPANADAADWLSSKNAGKFDLVLRLYNPDPRIQEDFSAILLPTIKQLSCEGMG